jgi:stage V sporulation protein D (sporulation-specific penicillin-binding protein)
LTMVTIKTVKKRVGVIFLILAFVIFCLIGRMAYIQIFHSSWLKGNATDQRLNDRTLYGKRGTIHDRNGKALAVSTLADSIYAVPSEIKNPEDTAKKLAAILSVDAAKLSQRLKQGGAFLWVQRLVTDEQAKQIRALNLPEIGMTKESKRHYPNTNLASHILGFVGIDNQGLDGIELAFDRQLRGVSGRIVLEIDPGGRQIPSGVHGIVPSQDGNDLYLTIDQTIQFIVERQLDKAMRETKARAATVIAMNPKTGEVLALANRPDYSPEDYDNYPPIYWRNNAVSNVYEPGSTFKIITAAAGLQEKVVSLDEHFVDPGFIEVQGRRIQNWDGNEGGGSSDFVGLVKKSSNFGFITVGMRLGPERLYQYIDAFGFGKPTNIDLPGEGAGMFIAKQDARPLDIATMSIGQSIAVTPIQLLSAVCTIANEGVLIKPQIVREIRSKNGQVIKGFQPEVVRQAIAPETSQQMLDLLEKVVSEGGASKAAVPGYRIAGKTGTAQKAGATGGYESGKYVASFVGVGPLDENPIAIIVIVYEPQGLYYGGEVAAPIFSNIMREILQYYNISPAAKYSPPSVNALKPAAAAIVPNCLQLPVSEASRLLRESGFSVKTEGSGEHVIDIAPAVGRRVDAGTTITLYTSTAVTPPEGEKRVPYLYGKTIREAGELLGQVGLGFYPVGSGVAVEQEPASGTKIQSGSTVTVYFENKKE